MITKYRYTIENQTIETLNLLDIPQGLEFETIEFEIEEVDNSKFKLEILKKQAHEQLKETDWYITRFAETGKPIPNEILQQRQLIRDSI